MLSQKAAAMMNEVMRRKRIILCKVRPRSLNLLEPKAWAQMGSIPMARPDRTEYPVMFANPKARDPPAKARSPNRPRKSIETIDRE